MEMTNIQESVGKSVNELLHSFEPVGRPSRRGRFFTYMLITLAALAGLATFMAFARVDFWVDDPRILKILLNVDLFILILLTGLIGRRIAKIVIARRKGQAGALLHTRFVLLFALLTVTPAIVISVFSGLFFNVGVQAWFSDRVKTALTESSKVAEAYLAEHKKVISVNVYTMARDISHEYTLLSRDRKLFGTALDLHAEARNLDEALVFTPGEVIARSKLSFALEFEVIPQKDLETAEHDVVILNTTAKDRVRALTKIPNTDVYLLVGRIVDPTVSKRILEVRSAVSNYHDLDAQRKDVEFYFFLMFMAISLLLLLSAVWMALLFASRLVQPIGALIHAAEEVSKGKLNVEVDTSLGEDEVAILMKSFNRMTRQLSEQQENLLRANQTLDERRRFIEDILEGVTAGIISLDHTKRIKVLNNSALQLLGIEQCQVGDDIFKWFPESQELFEQLDERKEPIFQEQIKIVRQGRGTTLLVRIVREMLKDNLSGFILTFDDVSQLVSAQRKAAWADVARRIAHELRNPLTPIQLSAERLQKRYAKEIQTDREKFDGCVETIIRQVGNIGAMVAEFSNFARMPEPNLVMEDVVKLIAQTIDQEREGHKNIEFTFDKQLQEAPILCDPAQINQVLTNLIQNACDAIEEQPLEIKGHIDVLLRHLNHTYHITIRDNGPGFPKEERDLLTEPYVTKKVKGTGLGLAIVKKIIEDHEGKLLLEDAPGGGAQVTIILPDKNKSGNDYGQ